MKYFVFAVAALGMIPLAALLSVNRRWIRFVVWAMLAALALYSKTAINFFSYEEYRGSSRGMEVSVIYLLSLAILGCSVIRAKFPGFLPTLGAKLYALYFLLCLPSWGTAENTLFCWMETWKMIMIYLTYLAILAFLKMTGDVKSLVAGLAGFAIWNFVLVVKAHLQGDFQPDGAFPHQNGLAMAMHLFGSMFFAFCLVNGWRRSKFLTFAFVASVGCLLRTYSRAATALMPVSYMMAFVCAVSASMKGRFRKAMSNIAPFVVVGALGFMAMLPRIIERFQKAPEASGKTRVELALCAKEMIKDEPWRGVGINNWGIKINPPYDYAERAGRNTNRGEEFRDGIVETVYLLVGAECGIPALSMMIIWFSYYFFICARLAKRLAGTWSCFIPAGLFGGLFVLYVQSCLEWTLRMQMSLILQMVFFAMLDYLDLNWRGIVKEEEERKEKIRAKKEAEAKEKKKESKLGVEESGVEELKAAT